MNEYGVRDIADPEGFYDSRLGADIYLDLKSGESGLYRERAAPHIPARGDIGPGASLFELTERLDQQDPIVAS